MTDMGNVGLKHWYPEWSKQVAGAHGSGSVQLFILHGNVNDLIRVEKDDGVAYAMLPEFLATQMFGTFDSVLYYDLVRGPRALASSKGRLDAIHKHLERYVGSVEQLKETRQVGKVFAILDRYLELALLKENEKPAIGLILDYAHFMVPSSAVSQISGELGANLATLLNWARNPYFKRAPFAFCLISERLSDLNESLTRSSHTLSVELPFPDRDERLKLIRFAAAGRDFDTLCEIGDEQLAALTAGLSLVNLQGLMQRAIRSEGRLTLDDLKRFKKQMIEGECRGLIEFVEPAHTLELVVGQKEAKKRLVEDASLIRRGRLDAVPMGYLLCGPVGTGKTFLAECCAGSIGIPCVKLLNFRSKYVGETEGNLEKILKVLRVMGPVAVIIDEADAMLGDREGGSDSGTSSRVFSQFATQMGNTAYRGKIIWFLLTCRPDLLPIDIKRQGRCEVHVPLFYPENEEECREMFLAMGRKNGIDIEMEEIPPVSPELKLSGADIESIVTRAKRVSLIDNREQVTGADLGESLMSFIPSADSDEKQLQILAATLESTDIKFLPGAAQQRLMLPSVRSEMMRRFRVLKEAL